MRYIISIVTVLTTFAFCCPAKVFAAVSSNTRAQIIERELDCLAQKGSSDDYVDWGNVCYVEPEDKADDESKENTLTSVNSFEVAPIVVTSEPIQNDYNYNNDYNYPKDPQIPNYSSDIRKTPHNKEFWTYDNLFARENPLTQFEVGFDYYRVIYEEPGLMNDQGNMAGVHTSYTYRTQENTKINSLKDIFKDHNKVNMFKIEFDMSKGKLDYKSEGSGSDEDIENNTLEIRGLLGYDIPVRESILVTPYVGVGYRYHEDDSGGRQTTTGHSGYERENKCFYMPLGLQTEATVDSNWKFGLNLEYDLFVGGQQISHLEDAGMFYGSDGLLHSSDPLKHEQYDGYGLKAAFKVVKLNQSFDLFFQPYVNYWEKDNSDTTQLSSDGGTTLWYYDSAHTIPILYYEPKNTSTEYGVKMGFIF